jgi:SAM-dependent methyltransferase
MFGRQRTTKWYDGFLYSHLISPLQGEIMGLMDELIPDGSTVIDVGCGPGSLVLKLSAKCKRVTGVDKSHRMIAYARKKKKKMGAAHVTFSCEDASTMGVKPYEPYSFAIICMCLHGMSRKSRRDVIETCFTLSRRVILTDFISPFPKNILGAGQIILELIEGRESYRNFREWQRQGGIDGLMQQMGLKVIEEKLWSNGFGKTCLVDQD